MKKDTTLEEKRQHKKEYDIKYKKKNKEKLRKQARENYKKNKTRYDNYIKKYREKNADKMKAYQKKYNDEHKEERLNERKQRIRKNTIRCMKNGTCVNCGTEKENKEHVLCNKCKKRQEENRRARNEWREKNKLCKRCGEKLDTTGKMCVSCRKYFMDKETKLRERAIDGYGGKCVCCGEKRHTFLCIDHVNGDGSKHRKVMKGSIYRWAIRNNYPKTLRLLCYNCNMSLGFYGTCAHEPMEIEEALKARERERLAKQQT